MDWHTLAPMDIEKRSFEIITRELGNAEIPPEQASVTKRVIHTTADFRLRKKSVLLPRRCRKSQSRRCLDGADIVTDTNMARSGINKTLLARFGGEVHCFMSDEDVAIEAKARAITRAAVSMEKACTLRQAAHLRHRQRADGPAAARGADQRRTHRAQSSSSAYPSASSTLWRARISSRPPAYALYHCRRTKRRQQRRRRHLQRAAV